MVTEYPAAHSMDTSWFAIDANGEIGHFSSGEEGMVPCGLDYYDYIENLELSAESKDFLHSLHGLHRMGLYKYDAWGRGPYGKKESPKVPLNIKELPSDIRDKVSRIVFEHLEFSTTDEIQPCEHFEECRYYSDEWYGTDGQSYEPESEEAKQRREAVTRNLIEIAKSRKQQSEPDSGQAPLSPPSSTPPE